MCIVCNGHYNEIDMRAPLYSCSNMCLYCSHDQYFKNTAIAYILNVHGLRAGEYSDQLLETEVIRAKTRWLLRCKSSKYVTFKNETMITQVNNSSDLRQALNENLAAILTKKRKLLVAKEINNTLGKILMDVKMELMQNALVGEKNTISWFDDSQKRVGEKYGCIPRLKNTMQVTDNQ